MARKGPRNEADILKKISESWLQLWGIILCVFLFVLSALFYAISYFYYFKAVDAEICLQKNNLPGNCTIDAGLPIDPEVIASQVRFFATVPTFIIGLQKLYMDSDLLFERFFKNQKCAHALEWILAAFWFFLTKVSYSILIIEPFVNYHTPNFVKSSLETVPGEQFFYIIGFVFAAGLISKANKKKNKNIQ